MTPNGAEARTVRRLVRRLLLPPLLLLAALDLLLDEYLWRHFVRLLRLLEQNLPLAGLESRIRALPPVAAVPLFVLPGLAVLPFKLLGVWLLGQGAVLSGAATFLVAKTVGTGLAAWIFTLTRPTLLGIAWFRWLHDEFLLLRAKLHAWLESRAWWQDSRTALLRFKEAIASRVRLLRRSFGQGGIARRWRALRSLEAKRSRSEPR